MEKMVKPTTMRPVITAAIKIASVSKRAPTKLNGIE